MIQSRWASVLTAVLAAALLLAGCAQSEQRPAAGVGQEMVNITAADLLKRIETGEQPLIIDVRTEEEYAAGHIDGARLIPLQNIEKGMEASGIAKDAEIVLICRSGNRSAQAYRILAQMGYTNLINVRDGMKGWTAAGGPVVK